MDTFYTLADARAGMIGPNVVTIGNFDGVHRGHQALIATARELARDRRVVALSFDPHPVRFFRPELEPFELTTIPQRLELLEEHGADSALVVPFGEEIASKSPREFVQEILIETLRAEHVVVGEGFRFGNRRAGTTRVLEELGEELGFGVEVFEPVRDEGGVISSTRIREHVHAGRVEQIPALLGRPYTIRGVVVHGDARGRELGFPTANVSTPNGVLPPDGIYTTTLEAPAPFGALAAITYIGHRPTYEHNGERNIETFVLEWSGEEPLDLYELEVSVAFHEFIRPDQAFESSEALIEQMERDVTQARAFHGLSGA